MNSEKDSKKFTQEQLAEAATKSAEAVRAKLEAQLEAIKKEKEELHNTLQPLLKKQRKQEIVESVKGLTDDEKLQDAILLAGISDEDKLEEIRQKVEEVIKTRKYLQPIITDEHVKEELKVKTSVKPKTEPKTEPIKTRFVKL